MLHGSRLMVLGYPWAIHGYPWVSMYNPWTSIEYSRISMRKAWTSIDYSRISTGYPEEGVLIMLTVLRHFSIVAGKFQGNFGDL